MTESAVTAIGVVMRAKAYDRERESEGEGGSRFWLSGTLADFSEG